MTGRDLLNAMNEIDDELIVSAAGAPIRSISGGRKMSRGRRSAGGIRKLQIAAGLTAACAVLLAALLSTSLIRNARIKSSAMVMSEEFESADGVGEPIFLGSAAVPKSAAALDEAADAETTENGYYDQSSVDEICVPNVFAGCVLSEIMDLDGGASEAVYTDESGKETFRIRKYPEEQKLSGSIEEWKMGRFYYAIDGPEGCLTAEEIEELKDLIF